MVVVWVQTRTEGEDGDEGHPEKGQWPGRGRETEEVPTWAHSKHTQSDTGHHTIAHAHYTLQYTLWGWLTNG